MRASYSSVEGVYFGLEIPITTGRTMNSIAVTPTSPSLTRPHPTRPALYPMPLNLHQTDLTSSHYHTYVGIISWPVQLGWLGYESTRFALVVLMLYYG